MVPWTNSTPHPNLHLDRFSRFCKLSANSPYILQWAAPFLLKLPLRVGNLNPIQCMVPLVHPSLHHPKRHLERFSRAHDCDRQTDGQTDRPRCSVCSNRPHLRSTAMWPNDASERLVALPHKLRGTSYGERCRRVDAGA